MRCDRGTDLIVGTLSGSVLVEGSVGADARRQQERRRSRSRTRPRSTRAPRRVSVRVGDVRGRVPRRRHERQRARSGKAGHASVAGVSRHRFSVERDRRRRGEDRERQRSRSARPATGGSRSAASRARSRSRCRERGAPATRPEVDQRTDAQRVPRRAIRRRDRRQDRQRHDPGRMQVTTTIERRDRLHGHRRLHRADRRARRRRRARVARAAGSARAEPCLPTCEPRREGARRRTAPVVRRRVRRARDLPRAPAAASSTKPPNRSRCGCGSGCTGAVPRRRGDDIVGRDVNLAARIVDLAGTGRGAVFRSDGRPRRSARRHRVRTARPGVRARLRRPGAARARRRSLRSIAPARVQPACFATASALAKRAVGIEVPAAQPAGPGLVRSAADPRRARRRAARRWAGSARRPLPATCLRGASRGCATSCRARRRARSRRSRRSGTMPSYHHGNMRSSTSFRHSERGNTSRRSVGVAVVVAPALVVDVERRRGHVVGTAPHLHHVGAVLLGRLLLVAAPGDRRSAARSAATTAAPAASSGRTPRARARRCGSRGPAATCAGRRAAAPAAAQILAALARLVAALFGQVDVDPAREQVLQVPGALAVAEHHERVRHAIPPARTRILPPIVVPTAVLDSGSMSDLHVVTLCTGNAARSVMAGAILREHVPG